MPYNTLRDLFLEQTTGSLRDKVYLRHKPDRKQPYQGITFGEFGSSVDVAASALQTIGLVAGDRVAILSESRPEWLVIDHASIAIGAITVPMFPTLPAKQVEFIVKDSGAKLLVVSNDLQLGKALRSLDELSELESILILNDSTRLTLPEKSNVRFLFWKDFLTAARAGSFVEELPKPEDIVTIIYTSGTTGTPKGVMLSHSNLLSNIYGALEALPPISSADIALSFLPLSHAFERIAMYLFFLKGFTVAFAESIDTVAENLLEIRPTVMTGVPRFYERIYSRLMRAREKMPSTQRAIFDWGLNIGRGAAKNVEGMPTPISARILHPLADRLVLKKIRERTGGKIRFFVSGAAALPAEIGRAFSAFGLPIIEGYGMTEASPIISVNPIPGLHWGTVGHPLPNIEVTIDTDGEILTRGPHVMQGYYKHPEATSSVIDVEGWLHTGDIGNFDSDGYLRITDRKKHLFVSSGGKNIAPAHIEAHLEESRYIDQVLLIGDKRQYCSALIVPNFDYFNERQTERGEPTLTNEEWTKSAEMTTVIDLEIESLQKELATYERVRRYALIAEPFSVENGLLTPTLKIRRNAVESRYADLIDSLYLERRPVSEPSSAT